MVLRHVRIHNYAFDDAKFYGDSISIRIGLLIQLSCGLTKGDLVERLPYTIYV